MSSVDTRDIQRDSLFLMAEIRPDGDDTVSRVKVRNLSPGGMMAEGGALVSRGAKLSINLRNIGWISGIVAWVQDARFGIAFSEEIDPKLARAPVESLNYESPRFTRPSSLLPPDAILDKSKLRKL